MMDILRDAAARQGWLRELRRALHQIPEVGNELPETRAFVCARLDELGIPYRTIPGGSGLCAWIAGGTGGAVALRADMDALHLREETGLDYAARNGNMHACGHDAHTAMLLGAAALLQARAETLPGSVVLLFQSGEEGLGGAKDLLAAGALDEPYHAEAVFGQHAGLLAPELPAGHFGFLAGPMMASRDIFRLTVRGRGCHGAMPWLGVDPVAVSAQLVTALQTLISRESGDMAVLTVGSVHGGQVYNIIPDQVELEGGIRCLDEGLRAQLSRRLTELSQGLCAAMRASCDADVHAGYPVLVNDREATALAAGCAADLFGPEAVHTLRKPIMVSEDMAYLLQARPGAFWCFSTPPAAGTPYPNHSPRFCLDDSLLPRGAALLAGTALRFLARRGTEAV